jgi:hypothetical protein
MNGDRSLPLMSWLDEILFIRWFITSNSSNQI